MSPRTLEVQNQVRSTTSGVEYQDDYDLSYAETIINQDFLVDPLNVSGTLIMDLNYLRTAIRDIKGPTPTYNWFDPVASTASLITLVEARTALNNIQTFTGADDDSDTSPDYTSTHFIVQNASLETAISELDAALFVVSGTSSNEIKKLKIVRTGGHVAANTTFVLSALGAGWTSTGDTITWSSSSVFTENISIYYNGVLQLPGASIGDNNDVYFVASPDSLAFAFKIKTNDVIQIYEFP